MSALSQRKSVSEAEYLALDLASEIKNAFVNGAIYAMSGATEEHNIVTGNIFVALHSQRKKSCRVYMTAMRGGWFYTVFTVVQGWLLL